MALVQQDVIARLRRFIVEQVLGREEKLEDDTPLLDGGHLTSLHTLDLVAFINEEYGVEIDPEEIDEEHFASLRTISELVCSKAR